MLDRRSLIARGVLAGAGTLVAPRIAWGRMATDRRLVFVIQRGAADGLATLAPLGDPAYAGLRGDLAADFSGVPTIGGLFGLHPALKQIGAIYAAKQALFVHATASPYRDRSHFDGQNVLETGGARPYDLKSGWLNRLLGLLPAGEAKALAISTTIPAALRGPVDVASYAPSALPEANDDLMQRVSMMYRDDRQLRDLWQTALQTQAMAGDLSADKDKGAARTGQLAASLMNGAQGARVVMIETLGWDTHAGQVGRLRAQLTGLDAMIGALKDGLGADWSRTLVVIATEFGRTAAANGTGGTDHGTGSVAMLIGGAVAGGRIHADWPGLAPAQLYQARDLRPTIALDAVIAGATAEHFGLDPATVAGKLFPGSPSRPLGGLVVA